MMSSLKTFPSPCGDYGSYRNRKADGNRGIRALVSVPLRGLWFLSAGATTANAGRNPSGFPSPCGDYGSYRMALSLDDVGTVAKFPSPCGDYGSYLKRL